MRVLVVALLLAACARPSGAPAIARVERPPPELLISGSLARLDGGLAGAHAFLDAIRPGLRGFLAERSVLRQLGVDTTGAAGDRPIRVYVLDTKEYPRPIVFLVGVGEADKLRQAAATRGDEVVEQGGFALVGEKRAVHTLSRWALGTQAGEAPPEVPTASLHAGPFLAIYRDRLERLELPEGDMGALVTANLRSVIALLAQCERFELRLHADAERVSVELDVLPVAGSALAGFAGAQTPAKHGLLARLPAGPASTVLSGQLVLGPARAQVVPQLAQMAALLFGRPAGELEVVLAALLDGVTGEVAAAGQLGVASSRLVQLIGASDGAKVAAAGAVLLGGWVGAGRELALADTRMRLSFAPDAVRHDGVSFHRYTSQVLASPTGLTSTSVQFGGWDDVVGVLGEGLAAAPLVDAARGKAPRLVLSPAIAAALADSRARKESFFYFFGVADMLAELAGQGDDAAGGVVLGLGFPAGRVRMRLSTTREDVTSIMQLSGS